MSSDFWVPDGSLIPPVKCYLGLLPPEVYGVAWDGSPEAEAQIARWAGPDCTVSRGSQNSSELRVEYPAGGDAPAGTRAFLFIKPEDVIIKDPTSTPPIFVFPRAVARRVLYPLK